MKLDKFAQTTLQRHQPVYDRFIAQHDTLRFGNDRISKSMELEATSNESSVELGIAKTGPLALLGMRHGRTTS